MLRGATPPALVVPWDLPLAALHLELDGLSALFLLVNVTDREGDLYELFVQALSPQAPAKVHLLVRSRHDRKLEDSSKTLWQEVARQRELVNSKSTPQRELDLAITTRDQGRERVAQIEADLARAYSNPHKSE